MQQFNNTCRFTVWTTFLDQKKESSCLQQALFYIRNVEKHAKEFTDMLRQWLSYFLTDELVQKAFLDALQKAYLMDIAADFFFKFDKCVWLHNIRSTMLTLQLFALQHTCNNRDYCQTYSCLYTQTVIFIFYIHFFFLLIIMWHSFASSYKHKWRYLQNRKKKNSSKLHLTGACLSSCVSVRRWVAIGKLDFLVHTWSEDCWTLNIRIYSSARRD